MIRAARNRDSRSGWHTVGWGMSRLLGSIRREIRIRNYSRRTEQAYVTWARRFVKFSGLIHPAELGEEHLSAFLTHLAVVRGVSASTQNQALSALLFLYRKVLRQEVPWIQGITRAKQAERLPVVLSPSEVRQVLQLMPDKPRLVAEVLFGSGLRLGEALSLRIKDVDIARRELQVWDGKGRRARHTVLPATLAERLGAQVEKVYGIHRRDLRDGGGSVELPDALHRKYPSASREWIWQYLFPSPREVISRKTGKRGRSHIHRSVIQKAVRRAATKSGIAKRIGCHTFRHSFATHLLRTGYDIRTVQELLGHRDVRTTMTYTHVLNRGRLGVQSPLDAINEST